MPITTVTNVTEMSASERHRVFALRFRTEMCRAFELTGKCEYRDQCLFAHGECEKRTEACNEADGLDSDKSIRKWLRRQRRIRRELSVEKLRMPVLIGHEELGSSGDSASSSYTPASAPATPPNDSLHVVRRYRFDPYSYFNVVRLLSP